MEDTDSRPHILVCDDDQALRQIFHDVLAEEGYRVTVRGTICADLAEVQGLAPDLIILDLIFGGAPEGLAFLQRLKAMPATMNIPVLTCTAATILDEAMHQQLTTLGCAAIAKPFDLDALLAAIATCLQPTQLAVS
jgi:CheY-like chemotaxis protein